MDGKPAPVYDQEGVLARLDGDAALGREILAVFLQDTPGRLAALEEAVGRGRPDDVRILAHALKGAAANVGALAFSRAAQAVEKAARAGLTPDLPGLIARLAGELARLAQWAGDRAGSDE
ncbi:MAG: Hpt domain-containing protein [Candidatus Riflebacteria bacterium]|nr:Hpt domain-containing protein [Candidatus Riflebacteria bacterium]